MDKNSIMPDKTGIKTHSMGLLKKARLLAQAKSFSFFEFIMKNNISLCSYLKPSDGNYFIYDSFGLDGLSILNSSSTEDFWNGIIPSSGKILNFSKTDNSINQFFQFLSFEQKDLINSVSLYRFSNNNIFVLFNKEISESILHDLNLVDFNLNIEIIPELQENLNYKLFTLDFSKCIKSFIDLNLKNSVQNKENAEKSISKLIKHVLIQNFNKPHCSLISENNTSKVLLVNGNDITEDLLLNHLIKELQNFIQESAELISVSCDGIATSVENAETFLKVN